jgi:hypothetical protein
VLPNLIVIGAQKCGTTSLHHYLSFHPEIAMSRPKELNFFSVHWDKGQHWYERRFRKRARVRGESSPNYSWYPIQPDVPERIAAVVPEAKLIYLVGDPVQRTVAGYTHHWTAGQTSASLREAFTDLDENYYVWPSLYHLQLSRYLDHFPHERILVVAKEDLADRRRETLRRVFRFLDVDDRFDNPGFEYELNRTADRRRPTRLGRAVVQATRRPLHERYPRVRRLLTRPANGLEPPTLDPELQARLAERLRDDVARFRAMTGMAFADWSV